MPVKMNESKNTTIIIVNKNDFSKKTISINNSFYVFHYGDFFENDNTIEIYAPFYESLDFRELNLFGKYRKLVINKKTFDYQIITNSELENYNLDFPLKYENNVILRNIKNNTINGFIITKGLTIKKKIFFKDKYLCGEPSIIETYENNIKKYFLITFAYDDNNNGYFILIDLKTYKSIEIPLNKELNIGFHSIFIKKII
jgi:carotenoid cleavage dioxygenase-like enzyme